MKTLNNEQKAILHDALEHFKSGTSHDEVKQVCSELQNDLKSKVTISDCHDWNSIMPRVQRLYAEANDTAWSLFEDNLVNVFTSNPKEVNELLEKRERHNVDGIVYRLSAHNMAHYKELRDLYIEGEIQYLGDDLYIFLYNSNSSWLEFSKNNGEYSADMSGDQYFADTDKGLIEKLFEDMGERVNVIINQRNIES